MSETRDTAPDRDPPSSRRWQGWAAILVAIGCAVTIAYTVGENFWG